MKRRGRRHFNLLRILLLILLSDFDHFSRAQPILIRSSSIQQKDPRKQQTAMLNIYEPADRKYGNSLFIDIGHLSHVRNMNTDEEVEVDPAEERDVCNTPKEVYWDEDSIEADAVALSTAGINGAMKMREGRRKDENEEVEAPFEKRGGGGMSRHLFAAATAATLAVGTASLGLFYNSLKAYDQDEYGVSKKTGLNDKSKSKDGTKNGKEHKRGKEGEGKKSEKAKEGGGSHLKQGKGDDEPASPGSPTFANHITVVNNNISINTNKARRDIKPGKRCSSDETREDSDARLIKRNPSARAKSWHKYNKHAPFLERVEDYGKMAAASGAFAAAVVATYSAVEAHNAYHERELKAKQEEDGDGDDDKHKRSNLLVPTLEEIHNTDDYDITGLMPSILPCNGQIYAI